MSGRDVEAVAEGVLLAGVGLGASGFFSEFLPVMFVAMIDVVGGLLSTLSSALDLSGV